MKKLQAALILAALFCLVGCDFSPAALQAAAKSDDDQTLANNYYFAGPNNPVGQAAQQELVSRNAIPAADWPQINQHIVAIGMGPTSVEASWGQPSDVNTTTTAAGQDVQWVFRSCDTCSASYVYFTNNVVSSIQN